MSATVTKGLQICTCSSSVLTLTEVIFRMKKPLDSPRGCMDIEENGQKEKDLPVLKEMGKR